MEYLVNPMYRLFNKVQVTPMNLEPGGEMIRLGVGRNHYRPFARVDLWSKAFRVTLR